MDKAHQPASPYAGDARGPHEAPTEEHAAVSGSLDTSAPGTTAGAPATEPATGADSPLSESEAPAAAPPPAPAPPKAAALATEGVTPPPSTRPVTEAPGAVTPTLQADPSTTSPVGPTPGATAPVPTGATTWVAPVVAGPAPQGTTATSDPDEDDEEDEEPEEVASGDLSDEHTPFRPPDDRPVRPLPRVIAIANQKGGVGKTTTTVNLGAALALFGYRVLIVDLDPQGNATTGLGIDGRGLQHSMYDVLLNDTPMVDVIEPVGLEGLFLAPATLDLAGIEQELFSALSRELRLKRAVATVVDDYDFLFIDCPPSLGLITINAFAAASEILVPVQCEFYALEGLTQLQRIVSLVQRNLNEDLEITTVVLTMYDGRTRLSEDVANEVRRHFPTQTQGTVIPRTVRLSEAPSFGQPITTFDPASKGARAYKALAREVSDGAQKRAG